MTEAERVAAIVLKPDRIGSLADVLGMAIARNVERDVRADELTHAERCALVRAILEAGGSHDG